MQKTKMTEEIKKYPVMEKQMHAAEQPLKVIGKEPRTVWITNYAYYLKQKKAGESLRPLFGRMSEDKKFEVYIEDGWVEKNLWDDYAEFVVDKDGKAEINSIGKPKKRLLFDEKIEALVKFESPAAVEYWNKEQKARVTEEHEVVWLRMSKNLHEKLTKAIAHPRSTPEDFYVIKYDNSKAPADKYSVEVRI